MALQHYLSHSAQEYAEQTAVIEPNQNTITYGALEQLANRVRDHLIQSGIKKGDRIALMLHKSIDSVACIYGILKAGAAYIPIDVTGPLARAAYILQDCQVKVVFIEETLASGLKSIANNQELELITLAKPGGGKAINATLDKYSQTSTQTFSDAINENEDLAYILYTSGSTGNPKGVPLSHGNAKAFVQWCSQVLQPTPADCFSAHAPFHFDLSILDLYTPIKHGASIVLIPEDVGKEPKLLAEIIDKHNITIWYSAPSILTMLLQYGELENKDFTQLKQILFAGEVFPVKHLRALMKALPEAHYINLYGPTETNVCTYQRVEEGFVKANTSSLPIGPVCEHLSALVVDTHGDPVAIGTTGELIIAGTNVMTGYWNLSELTNKAFFKRVDAYYYRTGDLVIEDLNGVYHYQGRRDRMIKKRGFRIELGEIEAKLLLHPDYVEIAVVAIPDSDGMKIHAHLVPKESIKLSIIKLKKFCSEHLPHYMIPDSFQHHITLPKTSTAKTDYQTLSRSHQPILSGEV